MLPSERQTTRRRRRRFRGPRAAAMALTAAAVAALSSRSSSWTGASSAPSMVVEAAAAARPTDSDLIDGGVGEGRWSDGERRRRLPKQEDKKGKGKAKDQKHKGKKEAEDDKTRDDRKMRHKKEKKKKKKERSKLVPTARVESCTLPGFVRGEAGAEFRFSFTNKINLIVDCAADPEAQRTAIESAFVAYQNTLSDDYGCRNEVNYGGAIVVDIDLGECFDDAGRRDRRGLQGRSRGVAARYNTIGTCRNCAVGPSRSVPPELAEDSIGRRAMARGGGMRNMQAMQNEPRDGLVETLQDSNVEGVRDAVVLQDSGNDCNDPIQCQGLSNDGACCGVKKECGCPVVSDTYCRMSDCNLPNGVCCEARAENPKFLSCPNSSNACLCLDLDCEYATIGLGTVDCCSYTTCSGKGVCWNM